MGARWKHFKQVRKHRKAVIRECRKCGIFWQGLKHDLSKYSPTEFSAYAKHFQGNRSPVEAEKEDTGYSVAWQHHKGHNPHHWEWWVDFGKNGEVIAIKIPWKYVVEMVCDWVGAGQVYNKAKWTQHEPLAYYNKVRDGRYFHEDTERLILIFLRKIDKHGLEAFHVAARAKDGIYKEAREAYEEDRKWRL